MSSDHLVGEQRVQGGLVDARRPVATDPHVGEPGSPELLGEDTLRQGPGHSPGPGALVVRDLGGSSPSTVRSASAIRPPGFRTRKISASARLLRADRFSTPFEITTSTEASGSGICSISPCRNSVQPSTPASAAFARARSIIASTMSRPIALPVGPTRARRGSCRSRRPTRRRGPPRPAGGTRTGRGSRPRGPSRARPPAAPRAPPRCRGSTRRPRRLRSDRAVRVADRVLDLVLEHQVLRHVQLLHEPLEPFLHLGGTSSDEPDARNPGSPSRTRAHPQHRRQNERWCSTFS